MSTMHVPCKFLSQLFGLTQRRVQQLARDGVIPKAERGEYPLLGAVRGYVAFLQDITKHASHGNEDVARARARFEIARAEEKELEVAKLLGEVVLAEDVQGIWENAASNWRSRLLAIPANAARQVSSMKDRIEIEELLTEMMESTLTEIALYGNNAKDTKQATSGKTDKKRRSQTKATAKTKGK